MRKKFKLRWLRKLWKIREPLMDIQGAWKDGKHRIRPALAEMAQKDRDLRKILAAIDEIDRVF